MSEAWSMLESIRRKRDGGTLSAAEIRSLVEAFVAGRVPDYQMSAFLMAVYFQGLDDAEMTELTLAMARSGEVVDFGDDPRIVDKHSTGGVGDKTSLIVVPLVAAAGGIVAKMSGRGLGHSGGTVDKLEAIPGFRTTLTPDQFRRSVAEVGAVLAGQSGNLVPADKLLYALRDVTATVESIGLIASSIMSKKIAGGARRLVLDVKAGRGAFMPDRERAMTLSRAMVAIGRQAGVRSVAVVTAMDQPLGCAVGNALEVAEAVRCLAGEGPEDLTELCLVLGQHMLTLAGLASDPQEGREQLERVLRSGAALERFGRLVAAQGGDQRVIERPDDVLPAAPVQLEVRAAEGGWVQGIDALAVGRLSMRLGAGRQRKEDTIDPAVGVVLAAKVGDRVESGALLGTVHASSEPAAAAAAEALRQAYTLYSQPVAPSPLVLGTVG